MRIDKKEFLKKMSIIVACVCILSYAVFHIASLFGDEINTVIVASSTEESAVSFDGYIFRDSVLVNSSYSGAVDYAAGNGGRVAKGDVLATVYETGASSVSSTRELILALDEEIALLERSTGERATMPDLPRLKKEASNAYYAIMKARAEGTLTGVYDGADRLMVALNSINMLTNGEFTIKETLASLVAMKNSLIGDGGASETLYTDKSGYFYVGVDGYEKSFTADAAQNLDADSLRDLIYSAKAERVPDRCIGKISESSVWYFVCEASADEFSSFAEGGEYIVNFLGGGGNKIKMTLSRRLETAGGGLLVFKTNLLPDGFSLERRQSAEIVLESVSGIYIPKSALHRVDHKDSVYILKGSVVSLRRVEVIYRGDDYYVVRDGAPDEDTDELYLKTNDLLIISGANLFDGRILD